MATRWCSAASDTGTRELLEACTQGQLVAACERLTLAHRMLQARLVSVPFRSYWGNGSAARPIEVPAHLLLPFQQVRRRLPGAPVCWQLFAGCKQQRRVSQSHSNVGCILITPRTCRADLAVLDFHITKNTSVVCAVRSGFALLNLPAHVARGRPSLGIVLHCCSESLRCLVSPGLDVLSVAPQDLCCS